MWEIQGQGKSIGRAQGGDKFFFTKMKAEEHKSLWKIIQLVTPKKGRLAMPVCLDCSGKPKYESNLLHKPFLGAKVSFKYVNN